MIEIPKIAIILALSLLGCASQSANPIRAAMALDVPLPAFEHRDIRMHTSTGFSCSTPFVDGQYDTFALLEKGSANRTFYAWSTSDVAITVEHSFGMPLQLWVISPLHPKTAPEYWEMSSLKGVDNFPGYPDICKMLSGVGTRERLNAGQF